MSKYENVMIFEINNQLFAYSTKYIKENVTIEKIFEVPKSQQYIKGIFNLRNNAIPLIDTGILLFNESVENNVVIVIENNNKIAGILIDKLNGVVNIPVDLIDKDIDVEGVNKNFLEGIFEHNGEIIILLNFDEIFNVKKADKTRQHKYSEKTAKQQKKSENLTGYIIFKIKNEWFAIDVKNVDEILTFPENTSPIPESPNWLKGVFLLRNKNLILVDLPDYLHFNDDEEREKVILVSVNSKRLGLAVPLVKEIKWVEDNEILELKNDFIRNRGIIPLENGKRLVLILDVENLFQNIEGEEVTEEKELINEEETMANVSKYLHFRVGEVNLGINIKDVQEIVEFQNINKLPKAPDYILGMMNLRNSVISVVSLSKKLGIDESSNNLEDKRLIVFDGKPVSLMVDKLEGILSFNEDEINEPDENIEIEEKFLEGIAKLNDNNLIFILNIEKLLKKDEKYFNN